MLIVRKDDALAQVINFNGATTTVQVIIEDQKNNFKLGPTEEVSTETIGDPCITDCYQIAKKYHGINN